MSRKLLSHLDWCAPSSLRAGVRNLLNYPPFDQGRSKSRLSRVYNLRSIEPDSVPAAKSTTETTAPDPVIKSVRVPCVLVRSSHHLSASESIIRRVILPSPRRISR